MITALELENFKGVSSRQRVEFAPLTLLFGANSAGKSSILHALVYLYELILHGDADVDRTDLGGEVLELGGFSRLIHNHEGNRTMILRAEFATPGDLNRSRRDLTDFPFPDLEDEIESAWVEVHVQQQLVRGVRGAVISETRIGVGTDKEMPLVWLTRSADFLFARINLAHPALPPEAVGSVLDWHQEAVQEGIHPELSAQGGGAGFGSGEGWGIGDPMAVPVFALSPSAGFWALPAQDEPLRVIAQYSDTPTEERAGTLRQIETFLEMIVLGTSAQLVGLLRRALYLGPLRSVPPPGSLIERTGRSVSWADGLAAWDVLLSDRGSLVQKTNEWLERLKVGCRIAVQQLAAARTSAEEISADHVDTTIRRLLLDAGPFDIAPGHAGPRTFVLPSEVGAGISQIVPVVVAALTEARVPLVMIEQPEIHIHPALQADLGDLFISASATRQFFIETHSEHLILRLLRRIREVSAGELEAGSPLAFQPERLSVMHVSNTSEGRVIRRLHVDNTGEFVERWPHGFFEERAKELF